MDRNLRYLNIYRVICALCCVAFLWNAFAISIADGQLRDRLRNRIKNLGKSDPNQERPLDKLRKEAGKLFKENVTGESDKKTDAIIGEPFGVGKVTIPLTKEDEVVRGLHQLYVDDAQGRVHYPAFTVGMVGRFLGEILQRDEMVKANKLTVYFLFKGDAPLTLKIYTSKVHVIKVTPRVGKDRERTNLQKNWWREFHALTRSLEDSGDYQPIIETYLTAMLAKRLNLEPPPLSKTRADKQDEIFQAAALLGGSENEYLSAIRQQFERNIDDNVLALGLPAPIRWDSQGPFVRDKSIEIEKIASRVPDECFYIRFGNWDNQIWLKYLMKEYGGELGRMVSIRGVDYGSAGRMDEQLAIVKSDLADVFGGQLIEDVAFIGNDFYMGEGSSYGVMLQAKNGLLTSQLMNARKKVQRENKRDGAVLEEVEIDGKKVSFLHTPDNRLRSYLVVDDNFHLMTSSRYLVSKFLATAKDGPSVATTNDFQNVRRQMPLENGYSVFVYLPSAFYQKLLSPQYQIEKQRRVNAEVDIQLIQLARLTSKAETGRELTVPQMIAEGFLPTQFGFRTDDTKPVELKDGLWIDSMRGGRGMMMPIPDVEVDRVTVGEVNKFRQRADYVQGRFSRVDPLAVGIRRYELNDEGLERLVIDGHMAPMDPKKYGWIFSSLGEPMQWQVQPMDNDVISVRMSLNGSIPFIGNMFAANSTPYQLFLGVQDEVPQLNRIKRAGFFETLEIVKNTPGYIGSTPPSGLFDRLPTLLALRPDERGFTRSLLLGLHRMQHENYSVLAFEKRRLETIRPQLRVIKTTVPSQLHVAVKDIGQTELKSWVNTIFYQRALQTSQGNAQLLHMLHQHMDVPVEDCLRQAESILNGKLMCALEGEYRQSTMASGLQYWVSDQWPPAEQKTVPKDYNAQLLKWFRGCEIDLTMAQGMANVQMFLDLQREKTTKKPKLPSFSLWGGSKKKKKSKE